MVREEVAVFPRQQRIDEMLRHLVDGDRLAVLLAEELGDFAVVDVQYLRREGGVRLVELFLAGDVARGSKPNAERDTEEYRHGKGDDQQYLEKGSLAGVGCTEKAYERAALSTGAARRCSPTGRCVREKRPAVNSFHGKKRPTPEGAGLPGVVPSDIVNWEGNYILDTNTFLIVISQP